MLEYDDVANDQRKVVYTQRNEMMEEDDMSEIVEAIREDVVNMIVTSYIPAGSLEEQWDVRGLEEGLDNEFGLSLPIQKWLDKDDSLHEETLKQKILQEVTDAYAQKEVAIGSPDMRRLEKYILLQVLDSHWKEHLAAMDYLRQSIHLRGYAQKNPKQEYKRESFEMFTEMLEKIKQEVASMLAKVHIRSEEEIAALEQQQQISSDINYEHADINTIHEDEAESDEHHQPFVRQEKKVGRNDPCYCGSGKKFKQCHGKLS